MPTLSFEGETHGEIVVKVRRWLASLEGEADSALSAVEAIEQGAELTKDALRIIAAAAPGPIAQSELMKGLSSMGYKATETTKDALVSGAPADVSNHALSLRLPSINRTASSIPC